MLAAVAQALLVAHAGRAAPMGDGPGQQPTSALTRTPRPATPTPVPATPVPRPNLVVADVAVLGARHDPQTLDVTATFAAALTNTGVVPAVGPITLTWFADVNHSRAFERAVDTALAVRVRADGLAAGAGAVLTGTGGGALPFRDAPILAWARGSGVVGEGALADNVAASSGSCARPARPSGGGWATPQLTWRWPRPGPTPAAPAARQVEAAPAVVDLDGDGGADIVFATLDRTTDPDSGVLRAVDGATGRDRFAVVDATWRVAAFSAPAVGDLLGDGAPEIVAIDAASSAVLAFEADGTPLWRSEPVLNPADARRRLAGPSLADLDADGWPEILVDDVVLDAAGRLRGHVPPNALAVDLDLVGLGGVDEGTARPEIIGLGIALAPLMGGRWFEPLWRNDSVGGVIGFNAVANLDDDPYPEIVVVSDSGDIQVLNHNGEPFGPARCFARDKEECRGVQGGPPVLADVDGDGRVDIGVAGRRHFSVRTAAGVLLWQIETDDTNSGRTGAAAFDFDGDGAAEIVYADRALLRVIDGRTGTVRWQTSRTSLTTFELPVVADVDADGRADLVVGIGDDGAPLAGLAVYGNPAWPPARPVWNQHAFAHAFVDDAGRIPLIAQPSWQVRNGFRDAGLPGAPPFAQPDLTVGRLVRDASAPAGTRILARVGNAGSAAAGRGVLVAFHDGAIDGPLVASATLRAPLPAGAFVDVAADWPPGVDTAAVIVDPNGAVGECGGGWRAQGAADDPRENNIHIARLADLPFAPPTATPTTTPTPADTPTIGPTLTTTLEPWGSVTPTPTGTPSPTPRAPSATAPGTASATPGSPGSPSPTRTPSVIATSTGTPTASATAGRRLVIAWLPIALARPCTAGSRLVEAVLVVDTSAHMGERDGAWTRLDLAKAAATGVLSALADGPADRAALVTAGDRAAMAAPLGPRAPPNPSSTGCAPSPRRRSSRRSTRRYRSRARRSPTLGLGGIADRRDQRRARLGGADRRRGGRSAGGGGGRRGRRGDRRRRDGGAGARGAAGDRGERGAGVRCAGGGARRVGGGVGRCPGGLGGGGSDLRRGRRRYLNAGVGG
ncbi:MAG: VWA domain-containing protein [Anaerolineae bacterium]